MSLAAGWPNLGGRWFSEARKPVYSRPHAAIKPSLPGHGKLETPLAFEDLQRELHQRIYRFVMQLRFVVLPLPILVGGFVFVADPTPWRRVLLVATMGAAIVLSLVYDWHVRRTHQVNLEAVLFVVGVLLHPAILVATGGIASPVMLGMLVVSFVASTILARRTSGALVAVQILSVVVTAVLEYTKPLGSLVPAPFKTFAGAGPTPSLLIVYTAVASLIFIVAREVGCRIQWAFAEMLHRTLEAREQSLQLHRDQLSELTLLSGEIAHELKNPLASIKGLAALLARRSSGEEPEPLVVLRREVDRMQGILEEFLNLSRPLVPLNLAQIDLHEVATEVAVMHEGLSDLRGVSLEVVESDGILVRCDPRKVRQILVNLLQNALDASNATGRVWIRVAASEQWATVTIDDEGRGLAPHLQDRVFEAGVTTKESGSGLGLNVARGLARQHGGEVTLAARSPRGCTATLRLPPCPELDKRASTSAVHNQAVNAPQETSLT